MRKILIVEDDKSIGELERDYLEMAGFKVTIITDGKIVLEHLKLFSYDAMILDVMLPYVDGFEILKAIKDTKDFPVLLVSARKEEVDKIRGLGLGSDDYITKPFSPSELVARVKAHIENYTRLKSKFEKLKTTKINIGALKILKDSRQVYKNDIEIMLAQKEFDLLMFFIENPNIVFKKDDLFEKVWGIDAIGDSNTVTVHIAKLREKIERMPSKPQYIETVWGVGYRFKLV